LAGKVEFLEVAPGSLICDQHERADSMYVIAGGTVKVMVQASWLLNPEELDGAALQKELTAAATQESGAGRYIADRLPAEIKQTLARADLRGDLALALNDLLRDPGFHLAAPFAELVEREQLGRKVWTHLAGAPARPLHSMRRLNRLLLEAVCKPALPARKLVDDGEETIGLIGVGEITDWKALAGKVAGDKKEGDPAREICPLLGPDARRALEAARTAEPGPGDKSAMVAGLNALIGREPLLLLKSVHQLALSQKDLLVRLREFLPDGESWSDYGFQRLNRAYNRLLVDRVFPAGLAGASRPGGPPVVLVYHGSGEAVGEMGLAQRKPRSATCITLSHAQDDPGRELGPVQLVRIDRAVFDNLLAIPAFQAKVAEVVAQKHAQTAQKLAGAPGAPDGALRQSEQAERLRLMQGQKLMLIDLDRCTRCDECVHACVSTHDDGKSRLFLVGPRFDHYLVPATCRACVDPVCMIGCPVGSIHRGNSREIVIEDWCIGCGLCADQCPYGSIQMHDTGIFPEGARGWKFLPERQDQAHETPDPWTYPNYLDGHWLAGQAPFRLTRELREALAGDNPESPDQSGTLCFRLAFQVDAAALLRAREFILNVTSADDAARVWVNGTELATEEKAKRGKRDFVLRAPGGPLRKEGNLLAVKVRVAATGGIPVLLDARLDEVRIARAAAADVTIKQVTQLAVVCDLCSALSTGPACVHACPHEAALRINASVQLP
jgi:Fe-S-cluster-containing hydrogenase component 2/CRP-like cAMP-binding protein